MKKAKLALAAIAVFAVIGGALAFKSSVRYTTLWYAPGVDLTASSFITGYTTTGIDPVSTGFYTITEDALVTTSIPIFAE